MLNVVNGKDNETLLKTRITRRYTVKREDVIRVQYPLNLEKEWFVLIVSLGGQGRTETEEE